MGRKTFDRKKMLFNRLLRTDATESTKRWIAIWVSVTIIVCSFLIVSKYPDTHGIKVVWALISYACILLGMASFETVAGVISTFFGRGRTKKEKPKDEE